MHAATTASHEGNAPVVAVAAWSFVVVTSVTVVRPLKKPAEFRASWLSRERDCVWMGASYLPTQVPHVFANYNYDEPSWAHRRAKETQGNWVSPENLFSQFRTQSICTNITLIMVVVCFVLFYTAVCFNSVCLPFRVCGHSNPVLRAETLVVHCKDDDSTPLINRTFRGHQDDGVYHCILAFQCRA